MPTDVERTQQLKKDSVRAQLPTAKVGARAVVDLLRAYQPEKVPPEFLVIENRRRDAIQSLLQLLTRFQMQIAKSPYANASVLSLIAKYLVENTQCLFIAKPDLGAIRLVDNIFDSLLNSEKFDQDAWRLLAQIRFPLTKFALQDFSFFFAPQNSGRRLLNTITLNLLGSPSSQQDQVRTAIDRFVTKLNSQYKQNLSEFNSVCIETQAWFASQQRFLSKLETKVSQIQHQGNSLDKSEPTLVAMLNSEVGGKELPEMLVDFIYGEWRNSLHLVLQQKGENSADWKRQVSLTQSMVRIYEACQSEEGRGQYTRFLPSMLKGIKSLLLSVSDNDVALDDAFDPVELILNAMVRGAAPELKNAPLLEAKSVVNESFEVIPVDEKYLQQVDLLDAGDWIRIRTPDDQYVACKLTVKAENAEPWIFVNNTGNKIAKKNRYALAQGLRDGVVEIVGKGLWIDELLQAKLQEIADIVASQQRSNRSAVSESSVASELPTVEVVEVDVAEAAASDLDNDTTISLVSAEEQAETHHGASSDYESRTDDILANSELSILPAGDDSGISETETATESGKEEVWQAYYQEEKELTDEELVAAQSIVNELEVGALVNRVIDGKEQRCKLAVKMAMKDKFIFVNPVGVKVWDTESEEVVQEIARGSVTVLDSGVKFDRTLEQVVMNIQADKKGRG